jgi:hypothetical protein
MIGGSAITVAAAMSAPQLVTPSPIKLNDATIAVFELIPERAKAKRK